MNFRWLLPPAVLDLILWLLRPVHGFYGTYENFEDALQKCRGYEDDYVVKSYLCYLTKYSETKVKSPNFIDDRSIRLLNGFLYATSRLELNKDLKILDFGGAWGNHFFNVFQRLPDAFIGEYVICESEAVSRELSQVESPIRFTFDLKEFHDKQFEVCIASCVLPYLENPYGVLEELTRVSKYIILDRMPILDADEKNILTVQKSLKSLRHSTSYPAYFFSARSLESEFEKLNLRKELSWEVPEDRPFFRGSRKPYRGYLLRSEY